MPTRQGHSRSRQRTLRNAGTRAAQRAQPGRQTDEEKAWYQQIVDQAVESSYLKRYAALDEQAAPIPLLASDQTSSIVGYALPAGGGDLG